MHSYLCDHFSAYVVGVGAGVGVGVAIAVRRSRAVGLDLWRCVWFECVLAGAGLFGAKVHAIVERGYLALLVDELTGNLRYPGGIIAAMVGLFGGDGSVEGTFEGTLTATGMSGKLTHVDGRTGLWSWEGPPPAAVRNDE